MELALIFGFLGLAALVGLASGSDDDPDPVLLQNSGPPTDDLVVGTDGPDQIFAGDGDDTVNGGDGDDVIGLGRGNDVASGDAGNDTIFGGANADTVVGGPGDDQIFLDAGFDTYDRADFGPDWDAGDDLVRGGERNDLINDFTGSNELYGDEGADTLNAVDRSDDQGTPDTLSGGFGDDLIRGDDGDVITGGPGEDDFAIFLDATTDAATTLVDYDRNTETLTFEFDGSVPEFATLTPADLSSTYLAAQQQVQIFVNTLGGPTLIAVLNGQATAMSDLPSAGITLQRL